MTLSVRRLGEALGAEVIGFDLKRDLNAETVHDINAAWAEHIVLCFRDQDLTPLEFVKLARMFGEPVKQVVKQKEFSLPDVPEVGIVSSEHRDSVSGERVYRGGSWHTDHSHIRVPPRGTMLYAIRIPPQGGDTRFTNQRTAYRALPPETQREIEGLRAVHVYESKYSPRKMPTARRKKKRSAGALATRSFAPIPRREKRRSTSTRSARKRLKACRKSTLRSSSTSCSITPRSPSFSMRTSGACTMWSSGIIDVRCTPPLSTMIFRSSAECTGLWSRVNCRTEPAAYNVT